MSYPTLNLKPASPTLGAFVEGLDLSKPLTDAELKDLKQAHADYGVLFFRDQGFHFARRTIGKH